MSRGAASPDEVIAAFPFVVWDRGTDAEQAVYIFGWIPRPDGQRDFLVVEFSKIQQVATWWFTSSAKYSRLIHEYLGAPDEVHSDCLTLATALVVLAKCRPPSEGILDGG